MTRPQFLTNLLTDAPNNTISATSPCTPKMQLQVQGVFGGGRAIVEIRITDDLDWVQARYDDGTVVDITEARADVLPQGLALHSEIRLRTADGDGTMSITAVLATVE